MKFKSRLKLVLGIKLTINEQLQIIADNTRKIPMRNFEMDSWKCGTTCCALGDAVDKGLVPGLTLVRNSPYSFELVHPESGKENFQAAAAGLGLTMDDVDWLFYTNDYDHDEPITPQMVANRIESFIKSRS